MKCIFQVNSCQHLHRTMTASSCSPDLIMLYVMRSHVTSFPVLILFWLESISMLQLHNKMWSMTGNYQVILLCDFTFDTKYITYNLLQIISSFSRSWYLFMLIKDMKCIPLLILLTKSPPLFYCGFQVFHNFLN